MLQGIRKYTHGWLAGIIISILILSFALWGIHSYMSQGASNDHVAEVNGKQITRNELSITYERLSRQQEAKTNQPLTGADVIALKKKALQTLIDSQVMRQAIYDYHYRVSPEQLEAFLQAMPQFQEDGRFSPERVQAVLSSSLYTPHSFIDLIQGSLLIEQPHQGILASSFALPDEISTAVSLMGEKRNIGYVIIPNEYFIKKNISVSEQSIQQYYTTHQADFSLPEQITVNYLLLSIDDIVKQIHPDEKDLMRYYSENKNTFQDKDGKLQSYNDVKQSIVDAVARQQAEILFAKLREQLANISYEHPESLKSAADALKLQVLETPLFSKEKGTDEITQNNNVRQTAFSHEILQLGNNSDVIELSPGRLIVIRLGKHLASNVLPLAAVRQQIIAKLQIEQSWKQSLTLATQMKNQLDQRALPEQVAAENKLGWINIGFTGRHNEKVDQAILDYAFRMPLPEVLKVSQTFAIAKLSNGYAVIALKGKQDGVVDSTIDQQALNKQISDTMGATEYRLYQDVIFKNAKINIETNLD
ncbi:MAG: SurA N-terminal domain-containing protein [Gammaproteobacteria bacterium]|nr:SurA N-terminal domain-containing protein [Gammaproteobacteria bacterium]